MADERELQPMIGELLGKAVRRLVRRSRDELSKAAAVSRSRLALRQQQADLDHFWARLGKTAYHLVQAGEIDHPALRKAMSRIDELEAQIDALRDPLRPEDRLPGSEGPVT
jgi:hypothetical protein